MWCPPPAHTTRRCSRSNPSDFGSWTARPPCQSGGRGSPLGGGEEDLLIVDRQAVVRSSKRMVCPCMEEAITTLSILLAVPPEHRLDAEHQLRGAERLCDVVVRPSSSQDRSLSSMRAVMKITGKLDVFRSSLTKAKPSPSGSITSWMSRSGSCSLRPASSEASH